jgi:hypothetical protein
MNHIHILYDILLFQAQLKELFRLLWYIYVIVARIFVKNSKRMYRISYLHDDYHSFFSIDLHYEVM